jgi:hypothetical protein
MINSPCAKFITPIIPNAILKPKAISSKMELILNPLKKNEMRSSIIGYEKKELPESINPGSSLG